MKRTGQPPPIGPVTIIHHGKTHHGNWRRGVVRHNISHNLIRANVPRDEEGITWIRGHHDRRSAEVKALWAAYALRPEASMYERAAKIMDEFYTAWPDLKQALGR